MSKLLKLNAKNVISVLQNFSDLRRVHQNGFSRLILPMSITQCSSEWKKNHDYFPKSISNYSKFSFIASPIERRSLQSPLRDNTVNLGSFRTPAHQFSSKPSYRFYYDEPKPVCPPPPPKPCVSIEKKDLCQKKNPSPCPKVEKPAQSNPCGPKKKSADPCKRNFATYTGQLGLYRFASFPSKALKPCYKCKKYKPCKPKGGGKKKKGKRVKDAPVLLGGGQIAPVPCGGRVEVGKRCGSKSKGAGGGPRKGPVCPPRPGSGGKGGGGGGGPRKGPVCPPRPGSGGKGGGGGGGPRKGPVCPPRPGSGGKGGGGRRKGPVCPPRPGSGGGGSRKGSVCPPPKSKPCGSRGGGGGSRKGSVCPPPKSKSCGSRGGGGGSGRICKPQLCPKKSGGGGKSGGTRKPVC